VSNSPDPWFDSWRGLLSTQPWQSTLETWWRQFSEGNDASASPVFEKIATQSHSFFQLAEELAKLDPGNERSGGLSPNLDKMFEDLKRALDAPSTNQAQNLFWQMPLANWQRMVSSIPGFSNVPFAGSAGLKALDPGSGMEQFLSTPGLGYTRESQADVKKLARLSFEYLKAQEKYNAFFIDMSKESLDSMRSRLSARMEKEEEPLTSVREFYDLWVECSETVYQARTMTDQYSRLNGEMINALMALRQHSATMMDGITGMMNLPTREELDTMHRRAQAIRRTTSALKHEMEALRAREASLTQKVLDLSEKIEDFTPAKSKTSKKSAGESSQTKSMAGRTGSATGKARAGSGKILAGKKMKKQQARKLQR
jgi:class III poly(R)-hydroxyalkanoic acid synthase PhaE subunit